MSELEIFLNCLTKTSYPSEKTLSIANVCGYEIRDFLKDLYLEFGEKKAVEFIRKTFSKILRNGMFCYDLVEYPGGGNVCLEIKDIIPEFDENNLILKATWGPSKILDTDGSSKTIEQIIDNADMSEWSDVDNFIESILGDINKKIFELTGFYVNFDR